MVPEAPKFGNEFTIIVYFFVNCCRIDPNLKALVYGVGVAVGGEDAWNFVWNKYSKTDDPYEKRLLLRSLAEATEPWILSRYMYLVAVYIYSTAVLSKQYSRAT